MVWLETKYRDIADGNRATSTAPSRSEVSLETKYRDIADGNFMTDKMGRASTYVLETKYRDIADGNKNGTKGTTAPIARVGNQVPRYSGWKQDAADVA